MRPTPLPPDYVLPVWGTVLLPPPVGVLGEVLPTKMGALRTFRDRLLDVSPSASHGFLLCSALL
ncbi:hypothetical protein DL93DRAFT_2084880 [Clavulina sp. PMI_390]|nr:hypothetical protein DL93DRAFT_2084880 [Clavulina sp. PMI_390]